MSVREGLCATCQKLGIECTFKDEPVKRKRAEKFTIPPTTLNSNGGTSGGNGSGSGSGSHVGPAGAEVHKDRVPAKVEVRPMQPPELEALLEETDPPLVPEGFDSAIVLGLTADQDPFLLDMYNYGTTDHTSSFIKHSIRQVGNVGPGVPVQFLAYRDERNKQDIEEQRLRITSIAGKFEERLLALFFQFVYPTYPIVDRMQFFRDYYSKRANINPGLLAGMLALSCVWWKYDAELCVHSIPAGLADSLYKECESCVAREIKSPTVATVQSLLLLLQRRLSIEETAETYAMTVEAARLVAVAHNLGLHIDCSNWTISPSSKRIRRRLWAIVGIMEKWTLVNCGSPLLLRPEDTNVGPYESDEPSERLFVHMTRLTDILDIVVRQLYSLKSASSDMEPENLYRTLDKVDALFERLYEWRQKLPPELQDMQRSLPGDFCRNGTLHLSALTVEVLLHRIRLRPQCMQLKEYGQYRAAASDTIRRVLVFTSEITHSHLHAFWHSASRLCFSTLAHFIYHHHMTSCSVEEYRATHEQLRRWLWALRVLAQGWEEGTGLAKFRLDTIFWMGNNLIKQDITNNLANLPTQHELETRFQQQQQQEQEVAAAAAIVQQQQGNTNPAPLIDFTGLDMDGIFDDLVINEEIIPPQEQAHLYQGQQSQEDPDAYAIYFDNWNQGVVSQQLHEILTEPIYD